MKALVCEDDKVVLKVIEVAMTEEGVDATLVNNGQDALDLLAKHDYDFIITDIHMPYVNGDAVLDFVHKEQGKNTPVIMISSDDEEEVVALALKSGVHAFVSKPVNVERLRKVIRGLRG
ncbi:MAG: response regulator [Cyclobacteriaceae bacterium]|nr:response regulator [Cyclobacteriaceae bacterium]